MVMLWVSDVVDLLEVLVDGWLGMLSKFNVYLFKLLGLLDMCHVTPLLPLM
jgi:hypothetical protein